MQPKRKKEDRKTQTVGLALALVLGQQIVTIEKMSKKKKKKKVRNGRKITSSKTKEMKRHEPPESKDPDVSLPLSLFVTSCPWYW